MDLLKFLAEIGVSTWIIVLIILIFVMDRVGILQFAKDKLKASSEFNQEQIEARNAAEQSEQVALWSQMTKLQSQALQQNELLLEFIIDTSKTWNTKHAECLDEVLERQQSIIYEIRQLAAKFTIMVSIVEQNYAEKKK